MDSSATVIVPGTRPCVTVFSCCRNATASRFSRPPYWLGIHSPCVPRVVEIQHRRHGVDAQAVDVELLEPEQRVAQQERAHLVAAVVEDQRAPVAVLALARVGVLVERGAVELARGRADPSGKWPGTQSRITPMPCRWHVIDEVAEVVRRAEPAGRREEADHLIAPRPGERMLHHRHQLDVRVAHLAHVRHERVRQLAVGQVAVALVRARAATTRGALRRPTSAARASRRTTADRASSRRRPTRSRRRSR